MNSFKKFRDPKKFRETVYPLLLQNEAENCLGIGIIDALISTPELYSLFHLGTIDSEISNTSLGAVWITPPHPLGMSRIPQAKINLAVEFALGLPEKPSGVIGPTETVERFKELWVSSTGAYVESCVRLFIYELKTVEHVITSEGNMRLAIASDSTLLVDWNMRFSVECGLGNDFTKARSSAANAVKYKSRFFWQIDNKIVSMAGLAGSTPNGIRIGWVYTPPELRGKGYASALVTSLSQAQLNQGKKFCFLHTDKDNATTNAIYQRIGYKKVSESSHYTFSYKSS